ncbi:ftsJ-like methyltransferase domain-containing protein [Trichoderma breve]|uniref:FtsJ-like methyltransferase domain-containing protein n=1 Tax=Trichoderma breve TaxID=2034170 RepID=A0A9W9ECC4_9HYPO|nr:ftsJ-like methyltransferase domain-containing protein [Trichoderma breve]KAJ4864066.1 ftsJ-like methyltransferase domain-containing protein [Trichoderma breve]
MDATLLEPTGTIRSPRAGPASAENGPQQLIHQYLLERSETYRTLCNIRQQGWENPLGDQFFQQQRQRADNPSPDNELNFYTMTIAIGKQLNSSTGAFDILQSSDEPSALDMGMAPGGFSATIMASYPKTTLRAVTLPLTKGGHSVHFRHQNVKLDLCDINTLAGDMDLASIPESHPAAGTFTVTKLLRQEMFDVVICGCQVTRNQELEEWREHREARRLQLAQLVIALEHLKSGGTLVAVMHKPEEIHTAELLQIFSKFSKVSLFKPRRAHAKRSSFYMVAKKIDTCSNQAIEAKDLWRKEWIDSTFGTADNCAILSKRTADDARELLDGYGNCVPSSSVQ